MNELKLCGYYLYHLLWRTEPPHFANRVSVCVPCGSHNKQLRSINRLVFVAETLCFL
jgi:hypothetical protein